jgi:hypothetical protein
MRTSFNLCFICWTPSSDSADRLTSQLHFHGLIVEDGSERILKVSGE